MQKINIKKYTKEQMLKMLEEAAEKQEAAEAEAAAHFKDGVKLAEENEKLRGEIGTLTEKLEANEKALDEMTAQYKSANHAAKDLRGKIEHLDKALSEATEKREAAEKESDALCSELARANEARKKAESESRELAKQLGEREIELAKVKQECESELAKQRAEAEKALMKMNATINGLLKRLEAQRDISEDYHQSLKWCMAHPWRNVWRCVKEHFRF